MALSFGPFASPPPFPSPALGLSSQFHLTHLSPSALVPWLVSVAQVFPSQESLQGCWVQGHHIPHHPLTFLATGSGCNDLSFYLQVDFESRICWYGHLSLSRECVQEDAKPDSRSFPHGPFPFRQPPSPPQHARTTKSHRNLHWQKALHEQGARPQLWPLSCDP